MKVLVTGGAGFLGSHLVEVLLEKNCTITIIDNLRNGFMENLSHVLNNNKLNFIQGDIRDYELCEELLKEKDIITNKFPIEETTEKYTVGAYPHNWELIDAPQKEYMCHFKGNTLVDITPRSKAIGYPLYLRN